MSVQDGLRIHEDLSFQIGGGSIAGSGSDQDGDFVMEGKYGGDDSVQMIRRYTYCTAGASGVGIPYLYVGRWDGTMIHGRWCPVDNPFYGGPFEMWPASEEDIETLRIALDERLTAPAGG